MNKGGGYPRWGSAQGGDRIPEENSEDQAETGPFEGRQGLPAESSEGQGAVQTYEQKDYSADGLGLRRVWVLPPKGKISFLMVLLNLNE